MTSGGGAGGTFPTEDDIPTPPEYMKCPYCDGDYQDAAGPGSNCGFCVRGVHKVWT